MTNENLPTVFTVFLPMAEYIPLQYEELIVIVQRLGRTRHPPAREIKLRD